MKITIAAIGLRGDIQPYIALGAGLQRIAMRVQGDSNPQNNAVFYIMGDQLGSTTFVADSSGNKVGEMRYMPCGEDRYTSGTASTNYK